MKPEKDAIHISNSNQRQFKPWDKSHWLIIHSLTIKGEKHTCSASQLLAVWMICSLTLHIEKGRPFPEYANLEQTGGCSLCINELLIFLKLNVCLHTH